MNGVDVVQQIRTLRRLGWSVKRTARELGLSRNSVRKYRDEAVLAHNKVGGRGLDTL